MLGLVVRIALPKGGARLDLSGKFGAAFDDAVALLRAGPRIARRLWASVFMSVRNALIRSPGAMRWI